MPPYFSTFLQLLGFSFGMFLLARYRLWKARRQSIPMELNPKTGRYEADLTLKKWERRAKITLWVFYALVPVAGYYMLTAFPIPSLPH